MKTFRELLENKEHEYNNEGGMSKGQLKTMIDAAQELHDMLSDNDNMPEWVQSKITKAILIEVFNFIIYLFKKLME